MIKAAVVGASGYTGVELLRILAVHAGIECVHVSSRQYKGLPASSVFPCLRDMRHLSHLVFSEPDPQVVAATAEVVFSALPHRTAMETVSHFVRAGLKVVDLSADFRFRQVSVYEEWYEPHVAPDLLAQAVYGLPEIYGEQIKTAQLVGNPGCYPTSVILGLAPLLTNGRIDPETIIADSKSGVSGAGRGLELSSLYCEANEGIKAYKVASHRHTPEMEQELSLLAGQKITISFTPHLAPMTRGILSTIYANLPRRATTGELLQLYSRFYHTKPFVRICPEGTLPSTSDVKGSNYADIGLTVDNRTQRVVVVSAIDNLIKGASGQAVQNMNLMCGLPETMGLECAPLYP
jgi:N-acetyl-gamma-glutamyl-phosphate reductase